VFKKENSKKTEKEKTKNILGDIVIA